jgi:DmsE family decaheme c-type cytochrome
MRPLTGSLGLWVCAAGVFFAVSLAGSRAGAENNPAPEFARPAPAATQDNSAKPSSDTSGYAGVETCKVCHDDLFGTYERTPHWKTSNDTRGGPSKQGCEGCHGPGAAHVQDPSGSPVFNFKTATSEAVSDRCLSCHASGPDHINATNSFHRQNEVSCIACHSQHHATTKEYLLVKAQPELCYSCHLQQKSQFNMPFRHRVNEGLIRCTDCHNQHGTAGVWESDNLIRQVRTSASGDVVCYRCHADKQGPFVFEHASVRTEGCATCHIPHGGANPHMLKYSTVNLLCLRCHTASTFSHAPVMNAQNSTQQQACTLCHVQIHGSNFSNYLFK